MALDNDALILRKFAANGDKITGLPSHGVTWDEGFPVTYETMADPPRELVNYLLSIVTAGGYDILRYGGQLPWDNRQQYELDATVSRNGQVYIANVANGPNTSNVTDPPTDTANAVWSPIGSIEAAPEAPNAPVGTVGNGRISWVWNCTLDNGSEITGFDLQVRRSGTEWSDSIELTSAFHLQSGLVNGDTYEARVRARNAIGTSGWSATGSAVPAATVPGRAAVFATPGNARATVEFLTFDDGGSAIMNHTIQWRSSVQSWSSGRERTVSGSTYTVTGLSNNTTYSFRVRANNRQGSGPWSNIDTARPFVPVPPMPSYQQRHHFASSENWPWPYADRDIRHASIVLFGTLEGLNLQRTIELGNGTWSGATNNGETLWVVTQNGTVRAYMAATGTRDPAKDITGIGATVHGLANDGTTMWVVRNITNNGIAYAYTIATRSRDSSKDINLGSNSNWTGATCDGTTLWFLNSTFDRAVAYNAATRSRDSSKDINLGSGSWYAAANDGTTMWASKLGDNLSQAYTIATRSRDLSKDINLPNGRWYGHTIYGNTLLLVDDLNDQVLAWEFASTASVVVNGSTYTETRDRQVQTLDGLNSSSQFNVTITGDAIVDVFPQAIYP